ncbi:6798_t:CDS:2, partial [Racocetra persica]
KPEKYELDIELHDKTINVDDNAAMILEDLSAENNLNILMDKDIIKMVKDEFRDNETDDKDNDEEEPPSLKTITEAIEALEKVIRYQEDLD